MTGDIQARARWFSAEMLVAARFAAQGYVVGTPLTLCGYDLLVDTGQAIWRVQVKHAGFKEARMRPKGRGASARYAVGLLRHRAAGKSFLACHEFDLLCAVCAADRIYVIPVGCLVSRTDASRLVGHLEFKVGDSFRKDHSAARTRWEPYLNAFTLSEV